MANRLSFLLIFCSFILSAQNKNDPESDIQKKEIVPLYLPDTSYTQKDNDVRSNQQSEHHQKPNQSTTPKTNSNSESWMLNSSLDNAPTLLKGIVSYLKSRKNTRNSSFCITVPSFHRLIFVGPPGSGKTTLAHAIGKELNCYTVYIPAASLLGRYRNETANNISQVFNKYIFSNEKVINDEVLIIIDELHKLFEYHDTEQSDHSQNAAAFWLALDEIERYKPNAIVIGIVNDASKLPPEIKSRFSGKVITIPMPDKNQKVKAFRDSIIYDNSTFIDDTVSDGFILKIINRLASGSMRDIRLLIDSAKMFYYAENPKRNRNSEIVLSKKHFQQALEQLNLESEILQENNQDKFFKQINNWGAVASLAINIIALASISKNALSNLQKKLIHT
jgi:SpoVK/Ycf46/Vps4 family AAA+-type ATPase